LAKVSASLAIFQRLFLTKKQRVLFKFHSQRAISTGKVKNGLSSSSDGYDGGKMNLKKLQKTFHQIRGFQARTTLDKELLAGVLDLPISAQNASVPRL